MTTTTSSTDMLDGSNNNNNNNNDNDNNSGIGNGNGNDNGSYNLTVSSCTESEVDNGDGSRFPSTWDVLALHHQSLAQKADGTGSIFVSGATAACPVPPVITTTTKTISNSDNIDDEVIVVPKIATILDNANLNDVEVSVSPTNLTVKKNVNSDKTKLKSIKAVDIGTITVVVLRTFASRMGITGSRKILRSTFCGRIIELKRQYDESDCTNGLLKSISVDATTINKLNSFRLLNVIFHENNYNRLDERAASLQKDDLDLGTKTGQLYFTFIANEYNSDNVEYGQNLYPFIITCDPLIYGTIDWIKARAGFNKYIKQYEDCCNNQIVSGTHDVFVDSLDKVKEGQKPLSAFGKGRILYTHELVLLYPGSLEEVAACLDKDVFRESCDADRNKKKTTSEKEKKRITF